MVKRACRCGRILHENNSTCPSCGRDMTQAPIVHEHLECNVCGDRPVKWDLLPVDAHAGDQCPCCFLADYDCDGKLVWIQTIQWEGETVVVGGKDG